MGIGKPYTHSCESFHVKRLELIGIAVLGPVLEGGSVAHPHVICEIDDDVRRHRIGIGALELRGREES